MITLVSRTMFWKSTNLTIKDQKFLKFCYESEDNQTHLQQPHVTHLYLQQPHVTHLYLQQPYITHFYLQQPHFTHFYLQQPHFTHLYLQQPHFTHLYLQQPQFTHLYLQLQCRSLWRHWLVRPLPSMLSSVTPLLTSKPRFKAKKGFPQASSVSSSLVNS